MRGWRLKNGRRHNLLYVVPNAPDTPNYMLSHSEGKQFHCIILYANR